MDKNDLLPILSFILIAILLKQTFLISPNLTFDDQTYLTLANQFLNGTYQITSSPYGYGFLFIILTACLGPALELLSFMGILIVAYSLLKHYYPANIAITTTLGLELSCFMFLYSGRVLPDMPVGLLIALSTYIMLVKPRYSMIAGFLLGFTIFFKFGGFILPILLLAYCNPLIACFALLALGGCTVYCIYRRKPRLSMAFILGVLIAIALYQCFIPAGQSVFTLAHQYDALQISLSQATWYSNILLLPAFIGGYGIGTNYFAQVFPLGALFIFALVGSFMVLKSKDRNMKMASAAFWLGLLYLMFGTESLAGYVLITVVSRYMITFAIVIALLAAHFMNCIYQRKPKLSVLLILLAIIIMSNVPMYIYFGIYHSIIFHFG